MIHDRQKVQALAGSSIALLAWFVVTMAAVGQTRPPATITGFTRTSEQKQTAIEQKFKARISRAQERIFHRYLTAEPHPAGSERNNELARYIAETWRQQGLEDVVIREYDVLNSFPRETSLEMVSPVTYKAELREAPYADDSDTRNPRVKSAYLGLSASGEVTAPIVYARSGNPEDYEVLRKNGMDVRGKIVLVRYSNPYSYRGFKALTAEREGAAAMIVYSDPAEDGYKRGKVFPDGPWGPETHFQRGAITYDFIVPGDPLTPGWASVPGAKRVAPEEARSLPKIIALPLSWHDAKPLLEHMGGPPAPKDWQGGLPIMYRLGGEARVHLKVDMDNRVAPNYVVEARIRGSELPEQWVVLGNHRDAWEFGGVDPSSGTASMLEMTRSLGALLKQGVRPRRTLVICSWDGEEVGLTGSTEWGEQFADELKQKAIAYINVDSSASGPDFDGSAVASLAPLLVETTKSLRDPSGVSLYAAWLRSRRTKQRRESGSESEKDEKKPITAANLADVRIGSGSDHTVFLNFLGVPVIGLQFDGPYGVYHSMYDDHFWIEHFGDPGFRYHALMSQLWGTLALRLANADALPFDFGAYARALREFVDDLQKKNQLQGHLEMAPLMLAIANFERQGTELNAVVRRTLANGNADARMLESLNQAQTQVEGNWLNSDGIPGRPWFKHLLYGARYTYAHLELPGLTEAVEGKNWPVAQQQLELLLRAVSRNAELLERTRGLLGGEANRRR
ncbi:MAG: M28 family metallopeptidase [Acidobacteriia bacterium]|nr:M28 family metallopeptidase [Terriglobia bacterium]